MNNYKRFFLQSLTKSALNNQYKTKEYLIIHNSFFNLIVLAPENEAPIDTNLIEFDTK